MPLILFLQITQSHIVKMRKDLFLLSYESDLLEVEIDGQRVSNFTSSNTALYIHLVDHPIH
ncbi:hypothetical protein [Paraglaciecola sp. MB-3u-78]|uniref:hypothetical protein n=1 Tax=Paraglaciecola sp. MB-3u-78 TaxID=2058332 RepID=UPI000C3456CB|nr:hypothetical protein [Paraglaciecola sp. MB-3u-78]PKG98110.1 hypothetical protein CXF95_17135 [Paraglaciecola sp. MB-3u-78]